MSKIFKAKFRDIMKENKLYAQIPADVWNQNWVVNCQAIGASENSIRYLAAYVFKVAVSNSRIVKVENQRVFLPINASAFSSPLGNLSLPGDLLHSDLQSNTLIQKYQYHPKPGFLSNGLNTTLQVVSILMG